MAPTRRERKASKAAKAAAAPTPTPAPRTRALNSFKRDCPSTDHACKVHGIALISSGLSGTRRQPRHVVKLVTDIDDVQRVACAHGKQLDHTTPHCLNKAGKIDKDNECHCISCGTDFPTPHNAQMHATCSRKHYFCVVCKTKVTNLNTFLTHVRRSDHKEKANAWHFDDIDRAPSPAESDTTLVYSPREAPKAKSTRKAKAVRSAEGQGNAVLADALVTPVVNYDMTLFLEQPSTLGNATPFIGEEGNAFHIDPELLATLLAQLPPMVEEQQEGLIKEEPVEEPVRESSPFPISAGVFGDDDERSFIGDYLGEGYYDPDADTY